MPERKAVVINTGPLIALVAAVGNLNLLAIMYEQVFVPLEVSLEIRAGGKKNFAIAEFEQAKFLEKESQPQEMPVLLKNSLDVGEASVIQLALNKEIDLVCIDETIGRRLARLNNLNVTGSLGILIKAKKLGYISSLSEAIQNMQKKGIWLKQELIDFALVNVGEIE